MNDLNRPIGNDLPASIGSLNGLSGSSANNSLNRPGNSSAENGDALNTMDDIEVMLANLSNQLDAMLTQGKN